MSNKDIFLTVCTPVYNGADTIHRVYNSLVVQNFKNFEWLIINDGSTDNLLEVIEEYLNDDKICIRIISQQNGHKKIAIKTGLDAARGKFFIVADADDEVLPSSFEMLYTEWEAIDKKDNFVGICGLCIDENNNLIGDEFPLTPLDCNSIELRLLHNVRGEKWGMCLTSKMRATYPDYGSAGKGHIPEGIYQRKLDKYKTRFVNLRIRKYYTNNLTSITNTGTTKKDYFGICLDAIDWLDNYNKYVFHKPMHFFMRAMSYNINVRQLSETEIAPKANSMFGKGIIIFTLPLALIFKLFKR